MSKRRQRSLSLFRPLLRTARRAGLFAGFVLVAALPLHAQVVPWLEPSSAVESPADPAVLAAERPATGAAADGTRPTSRDPRRERRVKKLAVASPEESLGLDPRGGDGFFAAVLDPSPILLSGFGGGSSDGAVRAGTTWAGQVTQNAATISVAGTARDDNGWGGRLSVDASGMTYLNISAQRDAGHLAPTLFIQFEDLSLRTKVISVSTSQFAVGALTLVQVPLTGWTIDFGPNQLASWSLGGGSVGTTDFRMTFDSLTLTATAIPEPATAGAGAALVALGATVWRRRKTGRS